MKKLNLPEYTFRITRTEEGKLLIFDHYRKKNVHLTPEEWVRQHILTFLTKEKGVPESLISIESGITINKLSRRYDALIYDRKGKAIMLIECKAPNVAIDQQTFDQVVAYNNVPKADYILVTNGLQHFCCKMDTEKKKYLFLNEIPSFNSL